MTCKYICFAGFYQTLKNKAEKILYSQKVGGPGPTLKTFLLQDFLAFSCIFLMIFAGWENSLNMSMIAGLVLGMNTGCAHNFFHQSNTWRRFYWDISLVRYLIIGIQTNCNLFCSPFLPHTLLNLVTAGAFGQKVQWPSLWRFSRMI